MKNILIASHGNMASGMESTLKILAGEHSNLTVIDAYVDESNINDVFDDYFSKLDDESQLIMLSDIYGGSINTLMYQRLNRPNTFLVAGVNLPLLLEVVLAPDDFTKESLNQVVEGCKDHLQLVELEEDESEDFF